MIKKVCLKFFVCTVLITAFCSCTTLASKPARAVGTYFVQANGNDRNNGLSEDKPFRSLFKAMVMANAGSIKTITVIGTLDVNSEQSSNKERVFFIQGMGSSPILITGKNSENDPPVLSAQGSGRRVVLIRGNVPIRFENIEISGGESPDEGGGMGIGPGSSVTLGSGAVIQNNHSDNIGGGVLVAQGGSLFIDGGKIINNRSLAVGGGIALVGKNSAVVFKSGEISGNHAQGGGGIAVSQEASFTLSGGTINDNTADIGGGGAIVTLSGLFNMESGLIRGNMSSGSGGGIALMERAVFILEDGEIQGNRAAEHGGGIASDITGNIIIKGGFISANSASVRGGGVFSAGPFIKSRGRIYGSDMPEDAANTASLGAAVFIYKNDGAYKTRETSAGDELVLDDEADDGWILTGEFIPRQTNGDLDTEDHAASDKADEPGGFENDLED